MQVSTTIRDAIAEVIETEVGVTPILRIWTGSAPAACATADSGTKLVEMTLPSDWLSAASSGVVSKSGTWEDTSADATGTAGHWRIYESTGTTCHQQGTIGLTGSGEDMEMDSLSITAGQHVTITAASFTSQNQ
jgi:cytochrome c5